VINYLLIRLLQSVFVLIGITAVCFVVLHLTGDPAALLLPENASEEDYATIRATMGFDRPLMAQFLDYMVNAFTMDFGHSYQQNQPAFKIVMERLPATIELALMAFSIALLIALPVGIVSATRRGSKTDMASTFAALLGQSMPNFWLGLILIFFFALHLDLLPTSGRASFGVSDLAVTDFYLLEGLFTFNFSLFWDAFSHALLPAITVGLYSSAKLTRLVRSSMLEVLSEDYVRTARAKGLSNFMVVNYHALKNASIPVVTLGGIELGLLLGGTVVTETVFAWPGVGLLTVQALQNDDFPVIQAAVFLLAFIFVFVNLAVDLLYAFLDPRIRLS
jgi:peptide/nickel transport system permease protein